MSGGAVRPQVVVVGAGVIGITAALELQRRGLRVRVVDREGVAAGASAGNAGAFAFSEIEPLATPGSLRKAPRWLLDPLGPLSIRPSYALRILPWLARFLLASRPAAYNRGIARQAALMQRSRLALERLVPAVDAEHLLRRQGQLRLYDTEHSFRSSLPGWRLAREHGVQVDLLDTAGALADIQPGLSPRFRYGAFTPDWLNVVDPRQWVEHLAGCFIARGGRIETGDVRAVTPTEDGVRIQVGQDSVRADHAVIAAGAWSNRLVRSIDGPVPLDTERGYNTTFEVHDFDLRTHLTFADHGFVVSRIGRGLRVGGAVEFGGLSLPPHPRRAEAMLARTREFLPGFNSQGGRFWMGFRPSMPDSLPVIRRARTCPFIVYAFGHGHLGLTQSAGTAELVADLIKPEAGAPQAATTSTAQS